MKFKQFLTELHNIEFGQAVDAHETPTDSSVGLENPIVIAEINYRLVNELNELILAPQSGFQKIRKVLHRFGFDLPALYEMDPEGDEITFDIYRFSDDTQQLFLYVLYYLTDDGHYDFYAQVGDQETINALVSDEDEEDRS